MLVNKTLIANVLKEFTKGAKATQALQLNQDKAIQAVLDAIVVNCDKPKAEFLKGNSKTNEARAQIKELFDKLVEAEFIQKSAGANYQSSFWLAFEHNVPFKRDLFKSFKKTTATKKENTPKAGKVTEYTLEGALKTLGKSLFQLRKVNQSMAVSHILDSVLEYYPEFKEPTNDE
jgi:hypothetical protein